MDGVNSPNELQQRIIQQIEYYFGDVNLFRDKFMKQELVKNDGWIDIETLLKFNRLRSLTLEPEVIIEALRLSTSGLVEISEDKSKLKRSDSMPVPELTDEYNEQLNLRTVHLKGFPKDSTFEQLNEYCTKFGCVESVQMRRLKDKSFKGCIFVVYKTVENAENAVNSSDDFNDQKLLRENKVDYFKRKQEWRKGSAKVKNKNKDVYENDGEGEENKEFTYKKGLVLKLSGLRNNTKFKTIKDKFHEYVSGTEYVHIDGTEGSVRFSSEVDVKTVLKCLGNSTASNEKDSDKATTEEKIGVKSEELGGGDDNANTENDYSKNYTIEINSMPVTVKMMIGEEEENYWKEVEKHKMEMRIKHKIKRQGNSARGGSFRKKRGAGYQGKKRPYEGYHQQAKQVKLE